MRERLSAYRDRVRSEVEAAFEADHSPREVAGSFALGSFIAILPTGGTALVLFVVIAYLFDRVSKLALALAIVVYNPIVKWSLYAASFWIGWTLLGPIPGIDISERSVSRFSFAAGSDVLLRQLLGNVLLAVVLSALGYLIVLRLIRAYRRRDPDPAGVLTDP